MTNTIFDFTEEDIPEGQEGFFYIAESAPEPKDDSFFDTIADYGKTILKGTIEGVSALGRALGPLDTGKSTSKVLEEQTETLEELIPTDEGFTQKALRRGLKQAPTMIAFPGGGLQALPRSIAAGFAGEGVKELGGSELAQTAAELTAFIGPDITKKLLEKGKHGEIIKKAREMGLSDKQIAPLLQGELKQKWLTKLVPRRGKTQEILAETKKGLGQAYEGLVSEKSIAEKALSAESSNKFIEKTSQILKKMPSEVRSKIKTDYSDLIEGNFSSEELINFYQDVNHTLGAKSKQLTQLKGPVKEALKEISPKLAEDFEVLNKLYGKYAQIQGRLQPNLMSDLIGAAKALQVLGGVAFGYYPLLAKVAGEQALSKISQQMLLNPRYQQLGIKIISAADQNKFGLAMKSVNELQKLLKKESSDLSEELDTITEEDVKSLFLSAD